MNDTGLSFFVFTAFEEKDLKLFGLVDLTPVSNNVGIAGFSEGFSVDI